VTLFFGAFNRGGDWPPIRAALDRVLAAAGERARIEVVADRALFDALATPRKRFTPMCDYATYNRILANADIALLPLADTAFNRMKSDLKFIEAAAHSVVALASPTVYAESIVDGETGLLFRTPEEFGARLARLIDDAEERDRIAGNAYRHVAESRLLCRHFAARRDWYRRLVAERARLDAELFAREPALR
jgi:glycosyltransferase involved in cell wall biosynthesis